MGNVSLRPDKFSEGGGLIDDFDGTITDIRFVLTDYQGQMSEAVPVAQVKFDVDGEESTQLFSVGGSGDFAPDETGLGLIKLRSKDSLTKTSKFAMLMESLVEAGFPINRMEDDISYLNGFSGHFLRKAVEYKGLKHDKKERDSTVLLCTKIIKLPWDNAPAAKGKAAAAKGKAKAEVDNGLADSLASIIQVVLLEAGGSIAKKNLMTKLFSNDAIKGMDQKSKQAALKMAVDDAYVSGREEWTVADGVLTIASGD